MVEEKFDRNRLVEGRNFGFGFAFLKKLDEGNFETLNAFTACKDYLNDFVYVETTGKPLGGIYGFEHKYTGGYFKNDYFYLGVKALHYNKSSKKYEGFDVIEKALTNNNINLIRFLNKLEDKFKFPKTEFEHLEDGILVLKVSNLWGSFGFLISLYTLYIRIFADITDEELEISLEDIISKQRKCIIQQDNFLHTGTKSWIEDSKFNELLNYEYPKDPSPSTIHNFGISARVNQLNNKVKTA